MEEYREPKRKSTHLRWVAFDNAKNTQKKDNLFDKRCTETGYPHAKRWGKTHLTLNTNVNSKALKAKCKPKLLKDNIEGNSIASIYFSLKSTGNKSKNRQMRSHQLKILHSQGGSPQREVTTYNLHSWQRFKNTCKIYIW